MTDFEKVELAFDMLEDAEVMQVFDDEVWIKVDREMWNEFNGIEETDEDEDDEDETEEDDDESTTSQEPQ
jgi:hypothetical protein